ncbi:uncharacterized protein LOC115620199 [Scaptodrosophila lebanonensis]|uniref:Uncharacterized protein LOC115620199 n=1 Tax=Drosophila lebanonensis TaxID=7225 RepID=A0A6J2T2T4_DROLE|nr:uncharacterized protein LOC115620199 [Scaptodrosophila lebanonensis]
MQYIYGILSPLSSLMGAQEIVWFISLELRTEHVKEMDEFIRKTDEAFSVTQTVVTNNSNMRMIRAPAKRNHASIVFTIGIKDPIMEVYRKVLTGRHFYFSTIILVDKIGDMQSVYDVCQFLYDYQFINTLLYFQSTDGINQLFGASIYPEMRFDNRTDLYAFFRQKYKELNSGTNVGGFRFHTPLRQDLPHLFKFRRRGGGMHYEGTTYNIIATFMQHLNGSFKELPMPPDELGGEVVNMKQVLQLVRERKVEFSAHAYALFRADDELEKSYPLLVVQWCLMVPLYNSVSTYLYPLQPFSWIVWLFVVGAFVSLVLLELLWHHLFRTGSRHSALLNSFCYIINVTATNQLQRPTPLRFLLLLTVFFHGFFLSVNYTSTLGSILTVNLFHAQLNTLEDIVRAKLPVMIIDYELEFLLSENKELPDDFRDLLLPVDSATFVHHQSGFNSSYGYFVTDDHWHFLDQQQKHLKQQRFKLSNICFGSYHLAYPIVVDSSLWRDLEYYTFRSHSSGLLYYYERASFESAVRARFVERLQEHNEYESAGLQHLAIAFICLLIMNCLAALILVLEIMFEQRTFAIQVITP